MRLIALVLLVVCFISCSKDLENAPVDNLPDSITVHLARSKNVIDSFTVDVKGSWTITPDTPATWIELSASSGSGTTQVYVKSLQSNNFSTDRTATFTITNTDNAAEKVNLTITQDKFVFSQWSKLYGGSQWDFLYSVVPTPDGGFIAVGQTRSSDGEIAVQRGEGDIWVVKIDAAGVIEWEKTYGGVLSDQAMRIIATGDGYAIVGYTGWSVGGSELPLMIKIDEDGNIMWEKTLEGFSITRIITVPSGGLMISGWKNDDAMLLRLDENGNTTWSKTYGGEMVDRATGLDNTADGGFIVIGNTGFPESGTLADFISQDIWIFKVDANGNVLWEKKQGGSHIDWAGGVITTDDGGAIIASSTESSDLPGYHGGNDILLTKIDGSGNLEWHRAFGSSQYEYVNGLIKVDGGFIFIAQADDIADGDITELFGETDAWIVKVDESGNIVYNRVFGGPGVDVLSGMAAFNGRLLLAGFSTSTTGEFAANHGTYDAWMKAIEMP